MEESIKRQKMRKYVRGKRKSKRLHTWIGISKGEEGEESWAEAIWEEIMAKKKKSKFDQEIKPWSHEAP